MRLVLLLLFVHGAYGFGNNLQWFLNEMNRAVNSGNGKLIGDLLEKDFTFQGCDGTIRKDQAIGYLKDLPKSSPIQFTLVPGSNSTSPQRVIKFSVNSIGLDLSESVFYYNMRTDKLRMGFDEKCSQIDFVGKTAAPQEMFKVVQTFSKTMNNILATRDKRAIEKLFRPDFTHLNCWGKINAGNMAESLADGTTIPQFDVLNVDDFGSSLRYVVSFPSVEFSVRGISSDRSQAEFYLNKKYLQLEMGLSLDCGKETQTDEAKLTYVDPDNLMKQLTGTLATRDFYLIRGFFTVDFQFKSCSLEYNQSQFAIALASIDSKTNVSLKISKVENIGVSRKIFVKANGLALGPIDLVFYHTPLKNLLTSGEVQCY